MRPADLERPGLDVGLLGRRVEVFQGRLRPVFPLAARVPVPPVGLAATTFRRVAPTPILSPHARLGRFTGAAPVGLATGTGLLPVAGATSLAPAPGTCPATGLRLPPPTVTRPRVLPALAPFPALAAVPVPLAEVPPARTLVPSAGVPGLAA